MEIAKKIKENFKAVKISDGEIRIKKNALPDLCRFLHESGYTHLSLITGVDYTDERGEFEVVYHLYSYSKKDLITVKTAAKVKGAGSKTRGKKTEIPEEIKKKVKDCIGCKICTKKCPQEIDVKEVIFGLKEGKDVDPGVIENCSECGSCEEKCPKKIEILGVFEMLKLGSSGGDSGGSDDYEMPSIPSITHIYNSADWHEREVYDLMGIEFEGHPNLRRMFLSETFEGYPLRKSYPLTKKQEVNINAEFEEDEHLLDNRLNTLQKQSGTGLFHLNMGPQHPSTHGVLRLRLLVDGEIIREIFPVLGYLHRGIEKIAENLNYTQFIPYTDRLDYVASMINNAAYVYAVEDLMELEIPLRAEYLRVIVMELQRIASHLIWFASWPMDLGATTPYFYTLRDRERILWIFEDLCGARLTLNYFRVGGVTGDMNDAAEKKLKDFLGIMPEMIEEYEQLLTENEIIIGRSKGVGYLSKKDAINYGVTGPILRSAGVKYDIRKAHTYSVYDKFKFKIPVEKGCDVYARYKIRMEEMRQSLSIISQALDGIPEGEIKARVPRLITPLKGESYSRVESPKGELGVYMISDGSQRPYRLHIRSPCFCNLSSISRMCENSVVADLISATASIDIVLGEIDR